MIRDITLGQYYKADSVIHRLDPRTKLMITFFFIVSLFLDKNPALYLFATLFLVVYVGLSKVPVAKILKGLKPIWILLVITMILNLFSYQGGQILWRWHFLKISEEGIRIAFYIGIRLIYLILGASIVTYTTTPNTLTDGIEKMGRPLQKIKVPVHEIAMMMSIALRFIPVIIEELDRIMKAQTARGARFNEGSLYKRLKAMLPVIIPLFVSAFRRAHDLAMAMDSRCYRGGEGRTKYKPIGYEKRDLFAYLLLFFYFAGCILTVVVRHMGIL